MAAQPLDAADKARNAITALLLARVERTKRFIESSPAAMLGRISGSFGHGPGPDKLQYVSNTLNPLILIDF
jgi:hypothetical protein